MISRLKWIYAAIAFVAALTGWISPDTHAQDAVSWTVQPFSEALKLLKVEESSSGVTFVLQNVQDKVITAYAACFSRGEQFSSCRDNDWSTNDVSRGLGKGDIDRVSIGILEASEYQKHILRIAAVFFDDGSIEGLHDDAMQIYLRRMGRALESRRESNILSSFSNSSLNDLDISSLTDKIGPIITSSLDPRFIDDLTGMNSFGLIVPDPMDLPDRMRGSLLSGISSARQQMLRTLDQLRKSPVTSADPRVRTRKILMAGLTATINETWLRMFEISKRDEKGMKTIKQTVLNGKKFGP